MKQPFTAESLAGMLKAGDATRFKLDLKTKRKITLDAAAAAAAAGHARFSPVFTSTIKKKSCSSIKDFSQTLILRTLSHQIKRRLRVKTRNRDGIVKSVIEALHDSTPMHIVRRDISSFYETLPTAKIRARLETETLFPAKIREYIATYFSTFCQGDAGVPRGIGLSAIIAELVMEDFDKRVASIPGVYQYFRYSDDILIFSFLPPSTITDEIDRSLPGGMTLNTTKSAELAVTETNRSRAHEIHFDYLGYRFKFFNHCGDKKPRKVDVCFPQRKLIKLKTRIVCSLKSFRKNRDFSILLDRLTFITSNYVVYRRGASSIKTSNLVKSGIHYNYNLCGTYSDGTKSEYLGNELKELDAFMRSLVNNSADFRFLTTASQKAAINRLSFWAGYSRKMTIRLHPDRVAEMKQVWRNA